ncbi:MAG: TIR domain-containing protein [Acidimicrobiia bacterium]
MSYDGFISYSHSADGRLAPALQKALQSFAKPWYRRRSLNIFRDNTGLSVAPHLWGAITEAMDDSEWFVLLTSPEAADSEWVNKEIDHWKETHSVDRILPVVTGGEWVWDPAAGGFDRAASTAVPDALLDVFTDEPRHLDLRWAHDETQLNARHGKFRDAVAQLAAPMHGKSKDDLEGEDIRRHRGAVRLAWTTGITIFVLLIAAVVAGIFAKSNADRAEERRKESDSQRLAAQSEQNTDRPALSFLLAAEAYDIDPTLQAEGAMLTALQIDPDLRLFIRGHDDEVWSAITVPDHDLVASGTASGIVHLTDRTTGETVAVLPGDGIREEDRSPIIGFATPDPDTLWALDSAGRIISFDLTEVGTDPDEIDAEVTVLPTDGVTLQVATVDPTGERLAIGSIDGLLTVFDTDDLSRAAYALRLDEFDVYAAAFSEDGSLLATGTAEGVVRVHDADTGDILWEAPDAHPGSNPAVHAVAFSENASMLASVGASGSLQLWDVATGAPLGPDGGTVGPNVGELWDVSFTGNAFPDFDGPYVATAGEDGQVVFWDPTTFSPLSDANRVHNGAVNDVFFADDSSFVTAGADRVAAYFETDEARIASGERVDAGEPVATVDMSPDGTTLAVASGPSGRVTLWDAQEHEPTDRSVEAGLVVQDLAFDPTGRWLAGAVQDGGILMWDTETTDARVLDAHDDDTINVAWSPDGAQLLSTAGLSSEATLWDVDDGTLSEAESFDEAPFSRGGAFSPDGRYLAYGIGQVGDVVVVDREADPDADERTRVLAVDDGTLDNTWEVAFHPTEPLLASAGADGLVHFWDLETFEETGEPLVGHRDGINDVAFLGDGARLLTSGEDGTVRLWGLTRREEVGTPLSGHTDLVFAVAPSPSGDSAASGSADGSVIFWDLNPASWFAEGCELVGRNLTETERQRFDVEGRDPVC